MKNEAVISKDMKVQLPAAAEAGLTSPTASRMISGGGLARQGSLTKYNCLCSPTTHAGSFRCRLHRSPSLQRTKSMDSPACQDTQSKATPAADMPTQNDAVNAQIKGCPKRA